MTSRTRTKTKRIYLGAHGLTLEKTVASAETCHLTWFKRKSPRPLVRVSPWLAPLTLPAYPACRLHAVLLVFHHEAPHLEPCFLLRCFQQFSLPEMATERCRWHDNSHTSAPSNPVLSY